MAQPMLKKPYPNVEQELIEQLPPWEESNCSQRTLYLLLQLGVYFPVLVLWTIVGGFYAIFILFYLIPNVEYNDSPPAVYYWHTQDEYFDAKVKAWILFGVLTTVLVLLVVSALRTMFTNPGVVPDSWGIASDNKSEMERRQDGHERICIRCEMKKPDRTHHCRQCERCTLRMDHHCNWIANCVGFFNYKYFICMLTYASLALGIIAGSFWETVTIKLYDDTSSLWYCFFCVLSYSISCMLFIVITVFLGFHLRMIWNNYSTIEFCEKKQKNYEIFKKSPYSVGVYNNFKQALGKNPLFWFIPTKFATDGDGISFINNNL
jgi:palmitoyltransferase ZDHHC2/15/20